MRRLEKFCELKVLKGMSLRVKRKRKEEEEKKEITRCND